MIGIPVVSENQQKRTVKMIEQQRGKYILKCFTQMTALWSVGPLLTTHAFGIMMSFKCDKVTVHGQ